MLTELLDYILRYIKDDSKDWREIYGELRALRDILKTLPSYYHEEAVRAVLGIELLSIEELEEGEDA